MQLYERHPEIRKSLDPNASYGEHYGHNTPLHYSARHCMKAMIRYAEYGSFSELSRGREWLTSLRVGIRLTLVRAVSVPCPYGTACTTTVEGLTLIVRDTKYAFMVAFTLAIDGPMESSQKLDKT